MIVSFRADKKIVAHAQIAEKTCVKYRQACKLLNYVETLPDATQKILLSFARLIIVSFRADKKLVAHAQIAEKTYVKYRQACKL